MNKLLAGLAFASLTAAPAGAAEINIWSTSFDAGFFETTGPFTYSLLQLDFGGGALTGSESLPGFGTQYLRNDTSGTTEFKALGLGAHTGLRLKFDLAFLDSWDSFSGFCCAPDILFVTIDGTEYQFTSNNAQGTAVYGPGTFIGQGFYAVNASWMDSVVGYDFLFPHAAADFELSIRFGGAGFQGGLDESWGIDNFALSAITNGAVPEPAAMALLASGLGLLGFAARRRRRTAA